jgi:hypothetical protein
MEMRVRFEMSQSVRSSDGCHRRRSTCWSWSAFGPSVQKSSTSQTRYALASPINRAQCLSQPRRPNGRSMVLQSGLELVPCPVGGTSLYKLLDCVHNWVFLFILTPREELFLDRAMMSRLKCLCFVVRLCRSARVEALGFAKEWNN